MKGKFGMLMVGLLMVVGCGRVIHISLVNIPHENGYRWEYKCYLLVGTTESSSFKRIRYIDGTTTLTNGLTVQNFISTEEAAAQAAKIRSAVQIFGLPFSSPKSYCYIDGTGAYGYGSSTYPTIVPNLIIPLPLEVGRRWYRGTDMPMTYEAVSREDISVSAGTFKAIKISLKYADGSDAKIYEWYADGVGLIKILIKDLEIVYPIDNPTLTNGDYIEELTSKNF